ncbi:hypothetical protein [Methylobacterium sp.]|uniref:hypothetical protein n=1 Tax=Methylobacterium sp. TaxID=409 RepID=UPI003B006C89
MSERFEHQSGDPVDIRGRMMAETDEPHAVSLVPPTVQSRNDDVPEKRKGREPGNKDVVKDAESQPDDPDHAAKDGLA